MPADSTDSLSRPSPSRGAGRPAAQRTQAPPHSRVPSGGGPQHTAVSATPHLLVPRAPSRHCSGLPAGPGARGGDHSARWLCALCCAPLTPFPGSPTAAAHMRGAQALSQPAHVTEENGSMRTLTHLWTPLSHSHFSGPPQEQHIDCFHPAGLYLLTFLSHLFQEPAFLHISSLRSPQSHKRWASCFIWKSV